MSSKPLEVRVPITELHTLVEKKSKQTDLNDTPELMSLPPLMTYLSQSVFRLTSRRLKRLENLEFFLHLLNSIRFM